jgi:hypothetical protein
MTSKWAQRATQPLRLADVTIKLTMPRIGLVDLSAGCGYTTAVRDGGANAAIEAKGHNSLKKDEAPLFQAGDMPTAQPVSERRLAACGPQGLLRCWVHTPLEAMAGQHQQQRSPHDGGPGIRRA